MKCVGAWVAKVGRLKMISTNLPSIFKIFLQYLTLTFIYRVSY
jgi:hypothetical protein